MFSAFHRRPPLDPVVPEIRWWPLISTFALSDQAAEYRAPTGRGERRKGGERPEVSCHLAADRAATCQGVGSAGQQLAVWVAVPED